MRHDYSTEQFQAFREEARESFWGQVRWRTQHILQQILEADSEQQMAAYLGLARYERSEEGEDRVDSRNGFYERDYVTPLGAIRLRVRRTRKRSFLPRGLQTLGAAGSGGGRTNPPSLFCKGSPRERWGAWWR